MVRPEYAMTNESLHARLARAGLGRLANDIIRLSMSSIRMDCRRVSDETALPLGSSKLGGKPDLQSSRIWPLWKSSPMAFVGQVNLADIAAHDAEGHLPHSGLLSFFCAVDGTAAGLLREPNDPRSWVVSHFNGDLAALTRLPLPPKLAECLRFAACQPSFSREPTLPDVGSREILGLRFSEVERQAYVDIQSSADVGYVSAMTHRLLGYPYCFDRSPLVPGYLKTHGIPNPFTRIAGSDPQEFQDRWEELQHQWQDFQHKAESEWRLLLQVFSNEEAQMDWGGGGVLHFCMSQEALSRRDFENVWLEMQFV